LSTRSAASTPIYPKLAVTKHRTGLTTSRPSATGGWGGDSPSLPDLVLDGQSRAPGDARRRFAIEDSSVEVSSATWRTQRIDVNRSYSYSPFACVCLWSRPSPSRKTHLVHASLSMFAHVCRAYRQRQSSACSLANSQGCAPGHWSLTLDAGTQRCEGSGVVRSN
jgi:hypothetical protein